MQNSSNTNPSADPSEAKPFLAEEKRWDFVTPISLLVLCVMSVVFIHSAQAYVGGNLWKMQIVWCVIGFSLYFCISILDYHFWMKFAHLFYLLAVVALCLVFFGPALYGAQRWIDLGPFKIQPAEAAKWATLILGASILSRSQIGSVRDSCKGILKLSFCFALPMFLIFLQPDLGSTLVFPPIAFSILYVARIPTRFFLTTSLVFVVMVGILGYDVFRYYQYKLENPRPSEAIVAYEETTLSNPILKDYQRKRILSLLAPEVEDPTGVGSNWNRNQALIAVATGGLSGKGLGDGLQAKLGFLPMAVAHNDFIFAVLAEESGLFGCLLALTAFALVIFGCLKVAGRASDGFGAMLAVGVAVLLMMHVFINIAMTIGITPITGLPLPFLSYGGSFIVTCFIMLGMVQSVYRFRKDFR